MDKLFLLYRGMLFNNTAMKFLRHAKNGRLISELISRMNTALKYRQTLREKNGFL